MNKRIRTGLLSAALVGGGLVGVTQLAGTANAQVDDVSDTTEQVEETVDEPVDETVDETDDGDEATGDCEGREGRGGRGGESFEAAAGVLGLEADDVQTQVRDGATLGEIADAQGVDRADVVDAIVQSSQDRIAQAVEDGRFTQDEADEKLAELEDRVTTRVDEGRSSDGEGRRGRNGADDADADAGATLDEAEATDG